MVNLGGLGIGLALGLGIAAFLEFKDASFRTDAEVLDLLSLPVLARIPRVETQDEQIDRERRRRWVYTGGAVCIAGMGAVVWVLQLWKSIV